MDDLITVCEKSLQIDPYQENLYRQLMQLYFAQGRRLDALRIFEKCKNTLRSGIDLDPEEKTLQLYTQLLAGGE